jgi:catechol 2,3-dioxygenase-like lactoylglutathione lyase family enzyme
MVSRIAQWTLDVRDVERMAAFWSAVLGYRLDRRGGLVHLVPPDGAPPEALTVWLQPVAGAKQQKLRGHLDLRPTDGDVAAEVERLLGLGAQHTDVGQQDDDPFVVLVDPEGNEFCVLEP